MTFEEHWKRHVETHGKTTERFAANEAWNAAIAQRDEERLVKAPLTVWDGEVRTEEISIEEASRRLFSQSVSLVKLYGQKAQRDEEVSKLVEATTEMLELYPQTYRCEPGASEMTHMEPGDWKSVRAKLEAALAPLLPQVGEGGKEDTTGS